jgi:hypothetical protein
MARLRLANPINAELTGAAVAWFLEQPTTTNTVLVPLGATWRYLDSGTNAGTSWRESDFDDAGWPRGAAELGYGDDRDGRLETTQLSFGTNSSNKHITYYFRHSFEVEDPMAYRSLLVRLKRDDDGIVYLNGREIFRSNMPEGAPGYLTRAADTADDDCTMFVTTNAPASIMVKGRNFLAVEIHQDSPTSSDISFDLALEGTNPPQLALTRLGADLVLTWDDARAVLETAAELNGTWSQAASSSPQQVQVSAGKRFFRLREKE